MCFSSSHLFDVCVDMLVATNENCTLGEFLLNETNRAQIPMYLTIVLVCSFLNIVLELSKSVVTLRGKIRAYHEGYLWVVM